MKVVFREGFALSNEICSCASCFNLSSSYHAFDPFPAPGVEDTAPAIAIAAEEDSCPDAAGVVPPDFAESIALPRASLIASASALAAVGEVKEKMWVSDVDVPGACAKTLSITFGFIGGVC